ncbi:MAG: MFS transporter, partial [Chryseobacterium sp.]|nr:MFS transporter [Chryseobacterium sp.]
MTNSEILPQEPLDHKAVHPILFSFLIMPFGISQGFIAVTLGYILSQAGISVDKIAALVALALLPHILKFIWAPLVDTTLSFKKWYILGNCVSAFGLLLLGVIPIKSESLPILSIAVFLSQFAVTFLCMATEGLMAYDVPAALKGRASGFLQAGNLGGSGLGGGLGLLLSTRLPSPWMVTGFLALLCLFCIYSLKYFKNVKVIIKEVKSYNLFQNLGLDIWSAIKTKGGILALILCFLTLGTGAASNLWSAIAKDWHASSDTVALVTGIAGGLISAVGCLIGGFICDRMKPQNAYVIFGLLGAITAVGMAYSPRTEIMFILWTSIYAVVVGLSYAGSTAFILEAIGKGAAATKYN